MINTQEDTISVTTFNILHNPLRLEERYELLMLEADSTKTDVLMLQEVAEEGLLLLYDLASQYGWEITTGTMIKHHITGRFSGNVTLSKELVISKSEYLPVGVKEGMAIPALITEHEGYLLINVHLPWGSTSEYARLETAAKLNDIAVQFHEKNPSKLIFMGGDFNATLDSATLRYLHGLDPFEKTSTVWTNAWSITTPFPTARKDGGWAEDTAKSVGIRKPELMPDRTIDHLMSFGWNYGKTGCPISLQKFGVSVLADGRSLSDHYGLTTHFLL